MFTNNLAVEFSSAKFDRDVEEVKEIAIRRFRIRGFWRAIILIGSSSYKAG
jgi:hypothetical protein